MNYQMVFKTLLLAGLAGVVTACSNDGYDEETPYVSKNFSNKLADGSKANLELIYSGDSLIGKNITFQTTDSKTADIVLENVLPHESETKISNVVLVSDGNGGFSFSGTSTSTFNTTFTYKGTVKDNKMKMDLSGVKIPVNKATGTLALQMSGTTKEVDKEIDGESQTVYQNETPLYFNSENPDLGIFMLVGMFAGAQINGALQSLTFSEDGNIVATYKGGNGWTQSPKNLITYYVENDTTMYITPNVDMIIRQIQKDKVKTRATNLPSSTDLQKMYARLNKWTTTGVKFTFKDNPFKNDSENYQYFSGYRQYAGDYALYVSKDEFGDFIPLLETYQDKIVDLLPDEYKGFVGGMLPSIIQGMKDAKVLEIGLFLNKKVNE